MKLKIRYENEVQEIDICTEEMWTWLNLSETCEEPLSEAEKNCRIQEVFDREFNRPDYNNWQSHDRRTEYAASGENLDLIPDTAAMDALMDKLSVEELKTEIRKRMKPKQAELIISIYFDEVQTKDYAAGLGIKLDNLDHRLRRAEKNFFKIFLKNVNFGPSRDQ